MGLFMNVERISNVKSGLYDVQERAFESSQASSSQTAVIAQKILEESTDSEFCTETEINLLRCFNMKFDEISKNENVVISEKFKFLVGLYDNLKQELTESHKDIVPTVESLFPEDSNSVIYKKLYVQILKNFDVKKDKKVEEILNMFFSNILLIYLLKNETKSVEEFSQFVEQNQKLHVKRLRLSQEINALKKNIFDKKIEFFTKWGKNLKFEFVQGFEDRDSVLYKGVCLAFSQRLYFTALHQPDITVEELKKEVQILPWDRFIQAAYLTNSKMFGVREEEEPLYFRKNKIVREVIFEALYIAFKVDFFDLFTYHSDLLSKTAGWVEFDLSTLRGGHAFLVRWDSARKCYWVIDANIGLFCFENPSEIDVQSRINCVTFLKELISVFYPYAYRVKGVIYTKKDSGEIAMNN